LDIETIKTTLQLKNEWKSFESVATKGIGVLETLKETMFSVIKNLTSRFEKNKR